ncbi:MAG: glucose-1-phosphate cytidylyltransferase [Verrucomicrobiota bacterium]|jgi:glucose-1-phosphate cytidylyltransferase
MQVMILCGGLGTRLREETEYRPKPMVEIGGRPILWHIMKIYAAHGFREFVLCLGYKGAMIKEYFLNYETFANNFTLTLGSTKKIKFHNAHAEEGWKITFVETGATAMTGARVLRALPYITSENFALTYGDGVADIDLKAEVAFHKKHGRQATLAAVRAPSRFGEMVIDELKHVSDFQEKPDAAAGRINGGFFILKRTGLEKYLQPADDNLIWERQPLEKLARAKQLKAFQHPGFWQPMDTYREFELLNKLWSEGKAFWKVW